MWRQTLTLSLSLVVVCLNLGIAAQRNKKNEEPKPQVLPLPPELPMALAADTQELDFHVSSLLRTGGLSAQIRQSLNDLIRDTHGETIVKLRAFVAGAGDARRVESEAAGIFSDRKLPLPVLSVIQVGGLGNDLAQVVIEAVVSTHRTVNPAGLAFFAGQYGNNFSEAVERLKRSSLAARIAPGLLLATTCFTSRMDNFETLQGQLHAEFPNAAINIVQALRDPLNDVSMCEAVSQLAEPAREGPVVWLKGARTTLANPGQLVFTRLQLSFGSFLDDAREAILRLNRAAATLGPAEAPVQINAFSLTASAGSALRKTTSFPPSTFTIQPVEGLPAIDATAGVEAILAPNVPAPVTLP